MAGGGTPQPSSGRKKSLDAEINLVPFIDLLSMCICFLLITAVWIQIGSVQVKQSHGTDAAAVATNQLELKVSFSGATAATVAIQSKGKKVKELKFQDETMEKMLASLDVGLKSELQKLGGGRPDLVSSALVTPSASVGYGHMVSLMDVLRKQGIVNLGVVPTRIAGAGKS